MVKAKIFKGKIDKKINISIENGSKETVFWVDEIEIDSKILRNLFKNFDKAKHIDDIPTH